MRASIPAIRPFGCRSLGRAQCIDRAARVRHIRTDNPAVRPPAVSTPRIARPATGKPSVKLRIAVMPIGRAQNIAPARWMRAVWT